MMNPSTNDQIEGKFHEVKGKIKETAGQATITPTWRLKAKPKISAARSKRKWARWKRSSRSRFSKGKEDRRC